MMLFSLSVLSQIFSPLARLFYDVYKSCRAWYNNPHRPYREGGAFYMSFNQITKLIGVISLVVFLLWGFLGKAWGISWIAIVIGALAVEVIKIIKDKK
jgi:hypothetical protein